MIYIIDTSSLIFCKMFYPPSNAIKFWEDLHKLNKEGKLVIISEIKDELKRGSEKDFLKNDFLIDKDIINTDFKEIAEILRRISNELNDDQQEGFKAWLKKADPYLIAYALYLKEKGEDVLVIHDETQRGNKLKIDSICNKYGISHGRINKLIENEKLRLS